MIVNKRSIFLFRLLSDLLMLTTAFIASAIIAQSWEVLVDRDYMFFLLIGLNLLWIMSSNTTGFYDDFYSRNFPIQFVNILKSTTTQVVAAIVFIFLAREDLFTRYFIVYYALILIAVISFRVILFRKGLKALRKRGKNIRNLLVIGDENIAENIKSMVGGNPDFGYNFVGSISGEDSIIEIDQEPADGLDDGLGQFRLEYLHRHLHRPRRNQHLGDVYLVFLETGPHDVHACNQPFVQDLLRSDALAQGCFRDVYSRGLISFDHRVSQCF